MIDVKIVLVLLFLHWIADFVLQSDTVAKGKSKYTYLLMEHTRLYALALGSGIFILQSFFGYDMGECFVFAIRFGLITWVFHTAQDYFTSKLNAKLYPKHSFWVALGFDQFLHFTQLILTYKILINA